jgi:hypothetical protein
MQDELVRCAAAFLRNKGKNVVTEKEFLMGVSMDLRWMPYRDAQTLLSAMVKHGVLEKDGEYLRPLFDESAMDLPVAYRPPSELSAAAAKAARGTSAEPEDLFQKLMGTAEETGIPKKTFLASSNGIQKKMNVDITVAGIIVLRDHGADVSGYVGEAYKRLSVR